MNALTPREIVTELDRYIVGQAAAKRSVAIALRNRWRRQQLAPDLREVFVMCDLEEVPGAEAATALGLREGTLWWRLSEARKALRKALEGMTP